MDTITIYCDEQEIAVASDFKYRLVNKSIPGARWDRDRKMWTYPSTPTTAQNIVQAWEDEDVVAEASETFLELLAEAEQVADDQRWKHAEADELPPVPSKTEAWAHQRRAFHSMRNTESAALFMAMGTGKSKVVVDLVTDWNSRMVLILCPKSVMGVWPHQFRQHSLKDWGFCVLDQDVGTVEDKAKRLADFLNDTYGAIADGETRRHERGVVIVNYESAWREPLEGMLKAFKWDAVVLDESHKVKNPTGRAGQFVRELRPMAKRRLILTGTPMPHSPLDVWNQTTFLDPGILGSSYKRYRDEVAIMGGYGGYEILGWKDEGLEYLERKLDSCAFRAEASELDLPDAMHVEIPVHLGRKALDVLDTLEAELAVELEEGRISPKLAVTRLLRMQQVTSGYLPLDNGESVEETIIDTAKAEALEDILEGTVGEPVVVFTRFRHDLDVVRRVTTKVERRYHELSGRSRQAINENSQIRSDADVIGVQISSGGVGIDLTAAGREGVPGASKAVYFSLGFSLGELDQSFARIHRPGQCRPVTYWHLIAQGTVDSHVYNVLQERRDLVEGVLERMRKRGEQQ